MTNKPKEWPYFAASVRDDVADNLAAALDHQREIAKRTNDVVVSKEASMTIDVLQNSLRLLERFGAKTIPTRELSDSQR